MSKDAAFIPSLKPKARQGMNSTGLLAKVLLHRTNDFFSPHSEDFSFEAGVSTPAGLPDCGTQGHSVKSPPSNLAI